MSNSLCNFSLSNIWNRIIDWFFPDLIETPSTDLHKLNLEAYQGRSTYRNIDLREYIAENKIHLGFHLWIPLACNYQPNLKTSSVDSILPEMIRTKYCFKTHMELSNLIPDSTLLITLSKKQKSFLGLTEESQLEDFEMVNSDLES